MTTRRTPWLKDKKNAKVYLKDGKTFYWDATGKHPTVSFFINVMIETKVADLIQQLDVIAEEVDIDNTFINLEVEPEPYDNGYTVSANVFGRHKPTTEELAEAEELLLERIKRDEERKKEREAKILAEADRIRARKS